GYHVPDGLTCALTIDGGNTSAAGTISITVVDNTVPTATGQTLSFNENSSANAITLSGTDTDSDTLTFAIGTGPSHGTLGGSGANRTYRSEERRVGPDSFTFTASDDGGNTSAAGTINITVVDNTVPTATGQTLSFNENSSANAITLSGTDTDSDTLTFAIGTGPSHGTLGGSGANRTY